MRKFSSYGPIDKDLHFYSARSDLIDQAYTRLVGKPVHKGGHFFTVWGPRQTGKTWIMQEARQRVIQQQGLQAVMFTVQGLRGLKQEQDILRSFVRLLARKLTKSLPEPRNWSDLQEIFTPEVLDRPLILIIDEFDALSQEAITNLTGLFRAMYLDCDIYRLHGLALVGVRAEVGVESDSGSPFNIQRSLRIPNLTLEEVRHMYAWYERDQGQQVEAKVVDRIYYETRGQPGLTCWLSEHLTETYNHDPQQPIGLYAFNRMYSAAQNELPNNNIMNLISKARHPDFQNSVLELFNTGHKILFTFDDEKLNYLYLHGLIDFDSDTLPNGEIHQYTCFACPLIQKRLFNAFRRDILGTESIFFDPKDDLSDVVTEKELNLRKLLERYRDYLAAEKERIFLNAPRRTDGRVYEAVYHFHLYHFLLALLGSRREISIQPEFPTGNGKVDLVMHYQNTLQLMELKSFGDLYQYQTALKQAAQYGSQLGVTEVTLGIFIEGGDETFYRQLEKPFQNHQGITVFPVVVPV